MSHFLALGLAFVIATNDLVYAVDTIPQFMNFQGFLTDSAGIPLDGNHAVRFGIYEDGTRIWYSEYNTVAIDDGFFAVRLGETSQGGVALNPVTGISCPL